MALASARTLAALSLGLLSSLVLVPCALASSSFGSIAAESGSVPIRWLSDTAVQVSEQALRMVAPGQRATSEELPLSGLQLYEITASMRRDPGAQPSLTLVYLDAHGKQQTWRPMWQFPATTRPGSLPLSPRRERYVQGFVLPPGATHVHLELQLEAAGAASAVARFHEWELFELRIAPLQKVACCGHPGHNLLLGGDLEGPAQGGLPLGVARWRPQVDGSVALVRLNAEPARGQVLRASPRSNVLLAMEPPVSVERGSAYRFGVCARGRGAVELTVQGLSGERPTPVHVGNLSSAVFQLQPDRWQRLTLLWFGEAPHLTSAQAFLTLLAADGTIEIDAVSFQPLSADRP